MQYSGEKKAGLWQPRQRPYVHHNLERQDPSTAVIIHRCLSYSTEKLGRVIKICGHANVLVDNQQCIS